MKVLVAGSTGFVGRQLCPALDGAGHEVVAMTRRPEDYDGAGVPVRGDVAEPASLGAALQGCAAAYYLVHRLGEKNFARADAEAATSFGAAAAEANVERIIYLGGLGDADDNLSEHLRSRREVEGLLGEGGVAVTVLRAGIIVGDGGISWEMTRQLVEHLPAMITPRWVHTKTQPIAAADVTRYLVGVLDTQETTGRVFDIGGPDVLEYVDLLRRVATIEGRPLFVLPVPLLSPSLSSRWLALVTNVDVATGRALIDSMTNEVVVRDDSIRALVPFEPMDYDSAVLAALGERAKAREEVTARETTSDDGHPSPSLAGAQTGTAKSLRQTGGASDGLAGRRRRLVTAAAVAVTGTGLLGASLSAKPGSRAFYALTFSAAGTWLAGGLVAEPLGWNALRGEERTFGRLVAAPVATGVAAFGVFYGAALVARRIPVLNEALTSVLSYAEHGSDSLVMATTLANGVAEEVFFRGSLFSALGSSHPVAASTGVYVAATSATRNPALVIASGIMGTVFAFQRRRSGGLLAPILTHVTWSALLLRYLPAVFRKRPGPDARR